MQIIGFKLSESVHCFYRKYILYSQAIDVQLLLKIMKIGMSNSNIHLQQFQLSLSTQDNEYMHGIQLTLIYLKLRLYVCDTFPLILFQMMDTVSLTAAMTSSL